MIDQHPLPAPEPCQATATDGRGPCRLRVGHPGDHYGAFTPTAPKRGEFVTEDVAVLSEIAFCVGFIWPYGHAEPSYYNVELMDGRTLRVVRDRSGIEGRTWIPERRGA